jgi:hypothetical protein
VLPRLAQPMDLFRDADTDDRDRYGDETETGPEPLRTAVPVWIAEQEQRVPIDGDLRLVTFLLGRAAGGTDIRPGDRLRSPTGEWYAVQSVTRPRWSRFRPADIRFELTRTDR